MTDTPIHDKLKREYDLRRFRVPCDVDGKKIALWRSVGPPYRVYCSMHVPPGMNVESVYE